MQKLTGYKLTDLEWVQPKTGIQNFELRAGQILVGRLSFRSSWGTLAIAETADGCWSFKRVGFLNPRITVRIYGEDTDFAVYQPKIWGDGVLNLSSGQHYNWKPVNFWNTHWAFLDDEDAVIVKISLGIQEEKLRDIFKTQATINIFQPDLYQEVLPLLVTLGLYLIILHQQDAAAAVAATSAATAAT